MEATNRTHLRLRNAGEQVERVHEAGVVAVLLRDPHGLLNRLSKSFQAAHKQASVEIVDQELEGCLPARLDRGGRT